MSSSQICDRGGGFNPKKLGIIVRVYKTLARTMNIGKLIINIVLTLAIIGLVYILADELFSPYFFEQSKEKKYKAVKSQMDEIVKAQTAYKDATGQFTGSFDSLAMVLKNDSIMQVRSYGEEGDTVKILGVTEAIDFFEIDPTLPKDEALRRISRAVTQYNQQLKESGAGESITTYKVEDTAFIPVLQTIDLKMSVDSLRYIPYAGGDTFEMSSDVLVVGLGRVKVPVFEVIAYNRSILKTDDARYYDPDDGIKLGSLTEATTDIIEFDDDEE